MLVGLLAILLIILLLVFGEDILGKYKMHALIVLGLCMALYAGLRPVGFDRDSPNYEMMFLRPESELLVEPFFLAINQALYAISSDVHVVLIPFAFVGIAMKLYAIKQLSPTIFLAVLIYSCNFYLLHDITQIRAGIASGLFLLSIKPMIDGQKWKALILMLIGLCFHYSSVCLLPLLFLNNKKIGRVGKYFIWAVIPLCFGMFVMNIDLLTAIPIPFVTEKVETYKILSEYGVVEKASILNPFPLIKIAFVFYLLYYADVIKEHVPCIYLIIKILVCSLCAYFALSSVTIISTRISEIYGVVEMIAYPCIVYTIKPKLVGQILVCIVAFIEIYFNLVKWEFLDFNV